MMLPNNQQGLSNVGSACLRLVLLVCLFSSFLLPPSTFSAPVPYAGKLAVNGLNFDGAAPFTFALRDANGTVHWRNGADANASINVPVDRGHYVVLLGGQGMNPLPADLFADESELFLQVRFYRADTQDWLHLLPDQRITSAPHALAADVAKLAEAVKPGAVTKDMLAPGVLDDLNATPPPGSIDHDMLSAAILADLNRTITRSMLAPGIRQDLNATLSPGAVSMENLSPGVLAALGLTPSFAAQPFARYDRVSGVATLEVAARGHGLSFQWLENNQTLPGATGPALNLASADLDSNATYAVRITNAFGQATSQTVTLAGAAGAPGGPLPEVNATVVPRNGLILWLDANDLNADGHADNWPAETPVAAWTSQVGDHNLTEDSPNRRPQVVAWPYAPQAAVSFDGNDLLEDGNLTLATEQIVLVFRQNTAAWHKKILNKWHQHLDVQISQRHFTGNFFQGESSTSSRVNGFNTRYVLPFTPVIAFLTPGVTAYNEGVFEALRLGNLEWPGEIGEILFYDRKLDANETAALEAHLSDKWGIPLYEEVADLSDDPDLLVHYKFEPTHFMADKLWDHSGRNRHADVVNYSPADDQWVEGVEGQALWFDGLNDRATTPAIYGEHETIALWFKPDFVIDGQGPRKAPFNWGSQEGFLVNGGHHFRLKTWYSDEATGTPAGAALGNLKGWMHAAWVFQGGRYNLYLDGAPVSTATVEGNKHATFRQNASYRFGEWLFQGRLDEFRVYDRVLAESEIQLLANAGQRPFLRVAREHNATVGQAFSLQLQAENAPTGYFAEDLPAGLSLNVATGEISGAPHVSGHVRATIRANNASGSVRDVLEFNVLPAGGAASNQFSQLGADDLPASELFLWLDASDVRADGQPDNLTHNGSLAWWNDKSPAARQAENNVSSQQPTYLAGALDGKAVVRFADHDDNLHLGPDFPLSHGSGAQNGVTVVALAASQDLVNGAQQRILFDFGHGPAQGWGATFRKDGGSFFAPVTNAGGGAGKVAAYSASKTPGEWTILTYRLTYGQAMEVFVDGRRAGVVEDNPITQLNSQNVNANQLRKNTSGPFTIGSQSSVSANLGTGFYGDLAEFLLYTRALDYSERTLVEQYLAGKWNLPAQLFVPPAEKEQAGLSAHWTFDEGSGLLAHDVSGNGRHAVLTSINETEAWTQGPLAGALAFDGQDDKFRVPSVPGEVKTFALWLNPADTNATAQIASLATTRLKLNDGNHSIAFTNDPGNYRTALLPAQTGNLAEDGWFHLAFRWNAATDRYDVFLNGAEENATVAGSAGHLPMRSGPSLIIDGDYAGLLDDLRVYSRSLSDEEIEALCDQDGDGLHDYDEVQAGTNPAQADSDGDGDDDEEELSGGSDPLDANSTLLSLALANGLVGHWTFDDGNGTAQALDASGLGRHATLVGFEANQTVWTTGKIDGALRLDGVNDYAQLPASLGSKFTVALWLRTTDPTALTDVNQFSAQYALAAGAYPSYSIGMRNGRFEFWAGTSNVVRLTSSAALNHGQWVHLVARRDPDVYWNYATYVNGVRDKVHSHGQSFSSGSTLQLGTALFGSNFLEADVDDYRIYDRPLSDAEIQALRNLGN